jgi:hypothetical protein
LTAFDHATSESAVAFDVSPAKPLYCPTVPILIGEPDVAPDPPPPEDPDGALVELPPLLPHAASATAAAARTIPALMPDGYLNLMMNQTLLGASVDQLAALGLLRPVPGTWRPFAP